MNPSKIDKKLIDQLFADPNFALTSIPTNPYNVMIDLEVQDDADKTHTSTAYARLSATTIAELSNQSFVKKIRLPGISDVI